MRKRDTPPLLSFIPVSFARFRYHPWTTLRVIPATRTMDADILVPRNLSSRVQLDLGQLMENNGFVVQADYPTGFHRFVHPDLNVEFLTDAGTKSDISVHMFKQLGITVQELRYMDIPPSQKVPDTFEKGLLTGISSGTPSARATAQAKKVFPAPRSPRSPTTSPGRNAPASSSPNLTVPPSPVISKLAVFIVHKDNTPRPKRRKDKKQPPPPPKN